MEEIITPKVFGDALRALREARALSQEDLAARCGMHRTYIGRLERGETNATIRTVERLAYGLGLSFVQLLTGIDEARRRRRTK